MGLYIYTSCKPIIQHMYNYVNGYWHHCASSNVDPMSAGTHLTTTDQVLAHFLLNCKHLRSP